jgi:acyl-coenzyme A synthetase/AMP-(fatty) acid ligase
MYWGSSTHPNRIYNVIDMLPDDKGIEETVCVGQKMNMSGEERVILFVKMKEEARFTPQLRADIAKIVERNLSRRHVPAVIMEVPEIVRCFPAPPPSFQNLV